MQRKCCYIVTSLINLVWLARIFFSKIFTPRRDVVAGLFISFELRSNLYLNMGMNCVLIIPNVESDVWELRLERLLELWDFGISEISELWSFEASETSKILNFNVYKICKYVLSFPIVKFKITRNAEIFDRRIIWVTEILLLDHLYCYIVQLLEFLY